MKTAIACLFFLCLPTADVSAGNCAGNASVRAACAGRAELRTERVARRHDRRRAALGCVGRSEVVGCAGQIQVAAPSCAGRAQAGCASQAVIEYHLVPVVPESPPCQTCPAPVPSAEIKWQAPCIGPNCPLQRPVTIVSPAPLRRLFTPLANLNARRARVGLFALAEDPSLTMLAVSKSNHRASRRITGHDGSGFPGARGEGVGWGSGEFHTCYWDTRSHRVAGAATAYDTAGRPYHTLLVR